MNGIQLWGSLALVAVLSGIGGGLVGARLGGAEEQAEPTAARQKSGDAEPAPEDAEGEGEEGGEVQALRGRLAALERRISLLTAAVARGKDAAPGEDDVADGHAPREADVADPVFEAAVLDIMDRERERAEGERETRRAELRAERTQRLSDGLAEALGLDAEQKQSVADVITQHFDAVRELRSDDNPDRPITPRQWRAKAEELEQKLQQNLANVLSPKQMAAYQALDPDDQISTRFGGFRARGEPRTVGTPPAPAR